MCPPCPPTYWSVGWRGARPPAFVTELEPTAARLLDRHLASAKEWFPHELVPWSRGRDFEPGSRGPTTTRRAGPRRSAARLFVNLLTEDNLPVLLPHHRADVFGRDSAWGEWNRRWTAEEGRHSIAIRDYLTVTRAIDPVALERARMAQVAVRRGARAGAPPTAIVYVALQELATRISHHNTGKLLDDPAGYEVMKRVAGDENRHYLFYRDLVTAALELDPSGMVIAIDRQVRDFEMPGTGIPDFATHARAIANAGIYDFPIHHDQILQAVVVRHWDLESPRRPRRRGRGGPALVPPLHRAGGQGRQAPRPPP